MNVVDIEQTVKTYLSVPEYKYLGEQDDCRFRHGQGDEIWKSEQYRQEYKGRFLQDCLHNNGTYYHENIDTLVRHTYEGRFFANDIEGYGVVSYPDGRRFEGLFKANKRFGPGIVTNPDGTQDVGLWIGKDLVRLNQTIGNPIPKLAQTVFAKTYLLNYKNLVAVQQKKEYVANKIMAAVCGDIDDNNNYYDKGDQLYSKYVRNRNSSFFNKKLFYDDYFANDEDYVINVTNDKGSATSIISKILVTHLVAWNNEKICVSIMRHTFRHRNQESDMSFNIAHVLTGMRHLFRDAGPLELLCIKFLDACCEDNASYIKIMICDFDLYLDVQDCYGNNGVMYAAVYDKINIIRVLTDFGANLDNLNDECLTPLLMCILRYIATKFEVTNWELAFLPKDTNEEFSPEIQEWRMRQIYQNELLQDVQAYLFDLSCQKPAKGKGKKGKEKKEKKEKTPKKEAKKKNSAELLQEKLLAEQLLKIETTVECLLNCGANPNYGDCPFPPLILSIFTKSPDIVLSLLQYNAYPNIRTALHLGSLTPLHIISSLAPHLEAIEIAEVLLTNGADPELRADVNHWKAETTIIKAGIDCDDNGKTPLHILCMRYDFNKDTNGYLNELCEVFLNLGAETDSYFLGHTPLTLAMLRGNTKLMKTILSSGLVNPNFGLGNKMGVPLTVLILKRYVNILPITTCQNIYETLLEFYANPLNDVDNFDGNTIEFCIEEHFVPKVVKEKGKKKSKKDKKSGKSSKKSGKSSKSSKKSKKSKKSGKGKTKGSALIVKLLYEATQLTLLKHVQRKAVQFLYLFKYECQFTCPLYDNIVKYLDMDTTLKYLQILLDNELIHPCKTFIIQLLEYVSKKGKRKKGGKENGASKKGKGSKKEKGSKKDTSSKQSSKPGKQTIEDLLNTLDFNKSEFRGKFFTFDLPLPDIDPDDTKFKVCFECFQKTGKTLILCPKCNLIYFCSQECNIKNNKDKKSLHPCKGVFYQSELELMLERIAMGLPAELNAFTKFTARRDELIRNDPDYFERIQEYDEQQTALRELEKERKMRSRSKSKKRKGSRSSSKSGISKKSGKSKGGKKGRGKSGGGSKERGRSREKGKKGKRGGSKGGKRGGSKGGGRGGKKGGKRGGKSDGGKDGKEGMEISKKDGYQFDEYGNRISEEKQFGTERDSKLSCTGFVTEQVQRSVSNVCAHFDFKFFLMFMPYCVFVNGQLYYKFDNSATYYKLGNYSFN